MSVIRCTDVIQMAESEKIGIRVPKGMAEKIEKEMDKDIHMSKSDFIRTAIKEKLEEK